MGGLYLEMNAREWIKSIIRALMCLFGIIGNNWLGFRSLPRSRSQLRTSDILFINLALSNLITNYLVDMPDTLDFAKRWPMGKAYCGAFNFYSDLSETSSIFTTMFITVFWHQKLVGSLKRGGAPVRMDNVRLVAALLAGSWTVAVAFSIPHFFVVSKDAWNETSQECMEDFPSQFAKQIFEMLYLLLANVVPIIGIMFASIQITVTLLQNQKRIRSNNRDFNRGKPPPEEQKRSAFDQQICAEDNSETGTKIQEPSSKVRTNNAVKNTPNYAKGVRKSQDRSSQSSGNLVRAAKSVVAVASLFLVCWVTHLLLSITRTIYQSEVVDELTSYIGAAYTCIIPYIYLHGVKKLNCSCKG